MSPFRRNSKTNTPEASAVISNQQFENGIRLVTESFDQLGIASDKAVIVGGAALAMLGIAVELRKPTDVDVVVPAQTMVDLARAGMTPSGIPLEPLKDHYSGDAITLTAPPSDSHLGADLITRYDPHGTMSIEDYDADFPAVVDHTLVRGYRVATPIYMLHETKGHHSGKKAQDAAFIRAHLRAQGINPRRALRDFRKSK